jgi:hypothetical protein
MNNLRPHFPLSFCSRQLSRLLFSLVALKLCLGPGRVEEAWKRRDEYMKDKDGNIGAMGLQAEATGE